MSLENESKSGGCRIEAYCQKPFRVIGGGECGGEIQSRNRKKEVVGGVGGIWFYELSLTDHKNRDKVKSPLQGRVNGTVLNASEGAEMGGLGGGVGYTKKNASFGERGRGAENNQENNKNRRRRKEGIRPRTTPGEKREKGTILS